MPTNEQMAAALLAEGAATPEIAECMRRFPRELFLPEKYKGDAYLDTPLPTVAGQTTSAPSMIAIMLREAGLKKGQSVLEIGTGSGWQTALISCLVGPKGKVVTVELVEGLSRAAQGIFSELGVKNTSFLVKDGTGGAAPSAPFDRIIVSATAKKVPKALEMQLKEAGILIIPLQSAPFMQHLYKFRKKGGRLEGGPVLPVMFVPLAEK